jgi:N-acetylglutamate synthase-like GNAT family acetyltransferase
MNSIRSAVLVDIPAIKDCAKAAYEVYVDRIGREPAPMQANFARQLKTHAIDVYSHHGIVVGYAVYQVQGQKLLLENVAVHPTYAGNGFGSKLIAHVELAAAAQDIPTVFLCTNEAMKENLVMYPKLGYKETHRIEEDGFKRIYFEKSVL